VLFLDESNISETGINWEKTVHVMEIAVKCLADKDFAQPIKPYLRYGNKKNRIIAMPAFVGGPVNMAGIKWVASFPDNIDKGLPRAHSVVILNNADTGQPVAVICTALLSIIRTASVSGLMIRHFDKVREMNDIKIGISGFGPIGQYHLAMCRALLGDRISRISLFDLRTISSPEMKDGRISIVRSWEEAYTDADLFITATVSDGPYIDKRPKPGSLHLNISLRDYKTCVYEWFREAIIIDDWDEVCREKTDVEMMHLEKGLNREDTRSIIDVVQDNCLEKYSPDTPIMFNPMGMAVFDIALGNFYFQAEALKNQRSDNKNQKI
jgi:2,3-diaminopropionate biosynthesis protein SbnB